MQTSCVNTHWKARHKMELCRIVLVCLLVYFAAGELLPPTILGTIPAKIFLGTRHRVNLKMAGPAREKLTKWTVTLSSGKAACHFETDGREGKASFSMGLPNNFHARDVRMDIEAWAADGKSLAKRDLTLNVIDPRNFILIEPDKIIYRPAEEIRFRVIVLDLFDELSGQPAADSFNCTGLASGDAEENGRKMQIKLIDAKNRVMKMWNGLSDVDATDLSYRMTEDATEGDWRILVTKGVLDVERAVQVKHFVLPRFTTYLKVMLGGKSIRACAKYNDGLPLKGSVSGSVCWAECLTLGDDADDRRARLGCGTCVEVAGNLTAGCVDLHPEDTEPNFANLIFEEEGTGQTVEARLTGPKQENRETFFRNTESMRISDKFPTPLDLKPLPDGPADTTTTEYRLKYESRFLNVTYPLEKNREQRVVLPQSGFYHSKAKLIAVEEGREKVLEEFSLRQNSYPDMHIWQYKNADPCSGSVRLALLSKLPFEGQTLLISHENVGSFEQRVQLPSEEPACEERDDELGHFTCHNGALVCKTGWTGVRCLTPNTVNASMVQLEPDNFYVHDFVLKIPKFQGPVFYAMAHLRGLPNDAIAFSVDGLQSCMSPIVAANDGKKIDHIQFKEEDGSNIREVKPGTKLKLNVRYQLPSGQRRAGQVNPLKSLCFIRAYDESLVNFKRQNEAIAITRDELIRRIVEMYTNEDNLARPLETRDTNIRILRQEYPVFFDAEVMMMMRKPLGMSNLLPATEEYSERLERPRPVKVRSVFPESWFFQVVKVEEPQSASAKGIREAIVPVTAPDTITQWNVHMFCPTDFGVMMPPTGYKLHVRHKFYVEINLPKRAVLGEELKIPISVFVADEKLMFRGANRIVVSVNVDKNWKLAGESTQSKCLPVQEYTSVFHFKVEPMIFGQLNFTATARLTTNSKECQPENAKKTASLSEEIYEDAIRRPVRIIPPGERIIKTNSAIVCRKDPAVTSKVKHALKIDLDNWVLVPGSVRAYAGFSGSILSKAVQNLDNLAQKPIGCGEQTMITTAPSISILRYLDADTSGTMSAPEKSALRSTAVKYIGEGYTREQNFRHKDGSFSAFPTDVNGSTWLTAFVLKVFAEADLGLKPDERFDMAATFEGGLHFLNQKWDNKICGFVEHGQVVHSDMQGPQPSGYHESRLPLADINFQTFVLTSLEAVDASTDLREKLKPEMQKLLHKLLVKARTCQSARFKHITESASTYSLAAYTRSLTLAEESYDRKKVASLKKRLLSRATKEGEFMYWASHMKSEELETTALAFLALQDGALEMSEKAAIVRKIVEHQQPHGGFYSTQDTILALDVLTRFQFEPVSQPGVTVKVNGEEGRVTPENSMVFHEVPLGDAKPDKQGRLDIEYEATGATGCFQLQSNLFYYAISRNKTVKLPFSVEVAVENLQDTCRATSLSVCARQNGSHTGMLLATVQVPTGYAADTESLRELVMTRGTARDMPSKFEVDKDGNLQVYFEGFQSEDTVPKRCFSVLLEQQIYVRNLKPGLVTFADYYRDEHSVTTPFNVDECAGSWFEPAYECSCKLRNGTEVDGLSESEQLRLEETGELIRCEYGEVALPIKEPIPFNGTDNLEFLDMFGENVTEESLSQPPRHAVGVPLYFDPADDPGLPDENGTSCTPPYYDCSHDSGMEDDNSTLQSAPLPPYLDPEHMEYNGTLSPIEGVNALDWEEPSHLETGESHEYGEYSDAWTTYDEELAPKPSSSAHYPVHEDSGFIDENFYDFIETPQFEGYWSTLGFNEDTGKEYPECDPVYSNPPSDETDDDHDTHDAEHLYYGDDLDTNDYGGPTANHDYD